MRTTLDALKSNDQQVVRKKLKELEDYRDGNKSRIVVDVVEYDVRAVKEHLARLIREQGITTAQLTSITKPVITVFYRFQVHKPERERIV